jgi:predicted amidohydrolase
MSKLKCFLIQYDIIWEDKISNINYINSLLENLNPVNSAIFLPEMFNTGFSMNAPLIAEDMQGQTCTWMRKIAEKFNCLVAGSLAIKENSKYYNRFLWYFPDGSCKYYDKKHLFRMGEEEQTYTQGEKRIIIEFNGFRFLPIICYDLRFPVWIRNKNEYDVIVCCASWPESRQNTWNTLLRARAIENQCYALGINRIGNDPNIKYCGDSQFINFKGECIESADCKKSIITREIDSEILQKFRIDFPVWKDMDSFELS